MAAVIPDHADEELLKDLGQLSAAVTHFLINAYSAVVSNTELIRARAGRESEAAEIERLGVGILKTAVDASTVGRKFIDWARRASNDLDMGAGSEHPSVQIEELVRQTIDGGNFPRVEWICKLGAVPPIAGDSGRLRSMLARLIQNAVEALPESAGTVTIVTRVDARGWGMVEVCDSGCGMTQEVLKQATEPFFSTKPGHAGVGLTIAQTIWRRHRGSLAIESQPGRGTTIRLMMAPPAPARAAPPVPSATAEGSPPRPAPGPPGV